jgi:hypothetical protein
MSAVSASIRVSILASRNAWWSLKCPVNASSSAPTLARIRARASAASVFRVPFAGDQRGQHGPPGDPEDVAGHHRQLDLRVLEQLLDPVLLRRAGGHQIDPVAGQVPQPADLGWRHEAGAEHLPLDDLGQPDRIQLVGLRPAGQVLDVAGVDQPRVQPVRLEQIERRLPVVAGGLHHHSGHTQLDQPVGHHQQRTGHRGVGVDLLPPAAAALTGHPDTADHRGLADIQGGDALDDLLVVAGLLQHVRLPPANGQGGWSRELQGRKAKLVRVLEATVKGPRAQLPASD